MRSLRVLTASLVLTAPVLAQEVAYVTTAELTPSILVVDPASGAVLATIPVSGQQNMYSGITFDGSRLLTIQNPFPSSQVLGIETGSGAGTPIGNLGSAWSFANITVHPGTGAIYATNYNGATDENDLYTIDPVTGVPTFVAEIGGPTMDVVQGIAIAADGTAYAVDLSQDGLFTFDLVTGSAVHLGKIKFPPGGFLFSFRDLAFDAAGELWAAGSPGNGGLFHIDLATLAATQVLPDEGFAGVVFRGTRAARTCEASVPPTGCVPALTSAGLPSAGDPIPFHLTAMRVEPGSTGALLYGTTAATTPFQGGLLCVGAAQRIALPTAAGSGTCGGTLGLDFNAWLQAGGDPELEPGATVHAQIVWREPGAPGVLGGTEAIEFALLP